MEADVIPVATGDAWIGYGVRSFKSVISELIENAEKELILTVYILTNVNIVSALSTALERGVRVTIYLYDDGKDITKSNAVREILALCEEYPYLIIKKVEKRVLHAKVIVADGRKVLSGSANLTYPALINNYELGFLIENVTVAGKMIELIKKVGE
jgi:cardiolipin synthase